MTLSISPTSATVNSRLTLEFSSSSEFVTVTSKIANRTLPSEQDYKVSKPSERAPRKQKRPTEKTLRRISGFLIETSGAESKVGLIEDGSPNLYVFPTEILHRNKILLKNQPFEMDEVLNISEGSLVYRFRALASAEDAYHTGITLDEDRKTKLALLLAEDAED